MEFIHFYTFRFTGVGILTALPRPILPNCADFRLPTSPQTQSLGKFPHTDKTDHFAEVLLTCTSRYIKEQYWKRDYMEVATPNMYNVGAFLTGS